MSNWEKYQKPQSKDGEPHSVKTEGMYMCQVCNAVVIGGKYYPVDRVIVYKCESDHVSLIEKVSWM